MISFCENCGRGFADVVRPKRGVTPPTLCPACRKAGAGPLSLLVGGDTREVQEREQREREAKA